jgi:hypothetical protein
MKCSPFQQALFGYSHVSLVMGRDGMGWHSLYSDCAMGQTVQSLNLIRSKRLYLLPNVQSKSGAQPASCSMGNGFFLVVSGSRC